MTLLMVLIIGHDEPYIKNLKRIKVTHYGN